MAEEASDIISRATRRAQRHRRKAVRLPVKISSIDPELDPESGRPCYRMSEEACGDVSRGGAFVITPEPSRPGQRLLLEMELPDGTPVQAIARVAWSRVRFPSEGKDVHTGFGVEFLGGTSADLEAIERFVQGQPPRTQRPGAPAPRPTPGNGPTA